MKIGLIIGIILGVVFTDINDIATINTLKSEAEKAYKSGNYKVAFYKYQMLVDSFQVVDDNLLLNYANSSYYLTGLNGKIDEAVTGNENASFAEVAMTKYQQLTSSSDQEIRSAAYNQIGVINYHMSNNVQEQGEKYLNESLSYFKQSLISNSTNDNARYNYEIVKKKLENQQNQDQENKDQDNKDEKEENKENKDQQNQDKQEQQEGEQDKEKQENEEQQENQEQQNQEENQDGEEQENEEQQQSEQEQQEQEEQESQQSPSEKLKEMNISEEMAKMILEALRNNEVQYIQQQKRKPTKKADGKKPDW